MRTCTIAGFLPSTHGFSFPNAWPPGPTMRLGPVDTRMIGVGDASSGLCGGMVLTVRDLFEAGQAAWDRPQPANGSGPFQSIVRRQVQSLDWLRVPLRYFDLMAFRPDPPAGLAAMLGREPARVEAMELEWRHIRAVLEGGHLCPIGLLRTTSGSPLDLTQNHQVLGFGYSAADDGSEVAIRIYDPNHPGDDAVELRASVEPPDGRALRERIHLSQSTGEPLLGFFAQPYPSPSGMRAWR